MCAAVDLLIDPLQIDDPIFNELVHRRPRVYIYIHIFVNTCIYLYTLTYITHRHPRKEIINESSRKFSNIKMAAVIIIIIIILFKGLPHRGQLKSFFHFILLSHLITIFVSLCE